MKNKNPLPRELIENFNNGFLAKRDNVAKTIKGELVNGIKNIKIKESINKNINNLTRDVTIMGTVNEEIKVLNNIDLLQKINDNNTYQEILDIFENT